MQGWVWIVVGLILLGLEMVTPAGFFILFFGIGALLVGLLATLGIVTTLGFQVLLFTAVSVASLLTFRRSLLEKMASRHSDKVDSLVGEIAILLEDLSAGGVTKAELRGTSWSARSTTGQSLRKGDRCRIERVEGLTLWVTTEVSKGEVA